MVNVNATLLRASDEEFMRWKEEAYQQRVSFNQWIRNKLNNVEMVPRTLVAVRDLPITPLERPLIVQKSESKPKRGKIRTEMCEHRRPKDLFCPKCDG